MERGDRRSAAAPEPVGVVVVITPWDRPLHQVGAEVAPALLAGCTVVLGPSAPPTGTRPGATTGAGPPAGVFDVVHGTAPRAGERWSGAMRRSRP